jgi:hypothetical protein
MLLDNILAWLYSETAMKNKLLIFAFMVFVLAAGMTVYSLQQPKNNSPISVNKNWERYSNNELGFTLEYPKEWKTSYIDHRTISSSVPGAIATFSAYRSPNENSFVIAVSSNSLQYEVDNNNKIQCKNDGNPCKSLAQEPYEKSGIPGIKITEQNTSSGDIYYIYFFHYNGATYRVSGGDKTSEIGKTISEIFETLEFKKIT